MLDYFDALREIAGTEKRIRFDGGSWLYCDRFGDMIISKRLGCRFVPTVEEMRQKKWEVEPEELEEIFVWGVCDNNGDGWVYIEDPQNSGYKWSGWSRCNQQNLFPKDKPVKYRLVLISE